jgi:methylmalonyl-CoA/ethylmalonyl-CoA epimerase
MKPPLVSHVGIAVADLKTAVDRYTRLLGEGPEVTRDVPDMGVQVAIFSGGNSEGGHLELLAATGDNSISRFVARRGEGIHHVCIMVNDIEKKLAELRADGVRLIDEVPRIGALGHKIAFVHPEGTHGVLIELEERSGE